MNVQKVLSEIEQGLGGKEHADKLHKLLQLWLNRMKDYEDEITQLRFTLADCKEDLAACEKGIAGSPLGTWEEYDMYEEIHWVKNQHVDGEDNYTGWVSQNIVRPGKYQELKLGKRVRIIVDE